MGGGRQKKKKKKKKIEDKSQGGGGTGKLWFKKGEECDVRLVDLSYLHQMDGPHTVNIYGMLVKFMQISPFRYNFD